MFKKTALTLFVSAIAMNAGFAMEKENPEIDPSSFKGSLNLCTEEKKETAQAMVIPPTNLAKEPLQDFLKKWHFSPAHYHIIDNLVDQYMMFPEGNAKILPKELLQLISKFSVKLVEKQEFIYTFPRATEIHKNILALSAKENFEPVIFQVDYIELLCEARHKSGLSKETVYKEFAYRTEKPQTYTKSGIFCDGFVMEGSDRMSGGTGIPLFNYVLVREDQSLETYQLRFNALCDFSGKKLELRMPYDVQPYEQYNYRKNIVSTRPIRIDSAGIHSIDNVVFEKREDFDPSF